MRPLLRALCALLVLVAVASAAAVEADADATRLHHAQPGGGPPGKQQRQSQGQQQAIVDAQTVTNAVQQALQKATETLAARQAQLLRVKSLGDSVSNEMADKAAKRADDAARQATQAAKQAHAAIDEQEADLQRLQKRSEDYKRALAKKEKDIQRRLREEKEASDRAAIDLDKIRAAAVADAVQQAKFKLGIASKQRTDLEDLLAKATQEDKQKKARTQQAAKTVQDDSEAAKETDHARAILQEQLRQFMESATGADRARLSGELERLAKAEQAANQARLQTEQREKQAMKEQIEATREAAEKEDRIREQSAKARARMSEQEIKEADRQQKAEADMKTQRRIEEEQKRKELEERSKEQERKIDQQREANNKKLEADNKAAEQKREQELKKTEEQRVKAVELEAKRREESEKEGVKKKEEGEKRAEQNEKAEEKAKAEAKKKADERAEQEHKEKLAAAQRKEATDKAEAKAEADTKQEAASKAEATTKAKEQGTKEQAQKAEQNAKAEAKLRAETAAEQNKKQEETTKQKIQEQSDKIKEQSQKVEQKAKQEEQEKLRAQAAARAKEEGEKAAEQQAKAAAKAEAEAKKRKEEGEKEQAVKQKELEANQKQEQKKKEQEKKAEEAAKAAAKAEQEVKAREQEQEQKAKRAKEQADKLKAEQEAKAESRAKDEAKKEQASKEADSKRAAAAKAAEEKVKKGTQLDLGTDMTKYGGEYASPHYIVKGPLCFLSGLVHFARYQPGKIVAVLPSECRPANQLIFDQHVTRQITARVDVARDGRIVMVIMEQTVTSGWLSLDKIFFIRQGVEDIQDVRLSGYFMNYGGDYRDAVWLRHGDLCVIEGLIRLRGGWGNPVATLPSDCRPMDGRLIFNLNFHQWSGRVDMLREGEIHYVTGSGSWSQYGWLSLTGIEFYVESASNALDLAPGFGRYMNGYRVPSWQKDDSKVCAVSGLATYSGQGHVATLPSECWPKTRLVFSTNLHQYSQRVDVYPNGKIVWVAGTMAHGWLALDGIVFVTDGRKYGEEPVAESSNKLVTKALSLSEDWSNYGGLYRDPTFSVFGPFCVLSGMVKTRNIRTPVAKLAEPCIPATETKAVFDRHVQSVETARVDVGDAPDYNIKWVTGSRSGNWLSLDGIIFAIRGTRLTALDLVSPYVPFGRGYDEPTFVIYKGFCLLQGVAREQNNNVIPGGIIGHLSDECVPRDGHIMVHANHNQHTNVIYIYRDGRLHWVDGPREHPWVSLAGIAFPAQPGANLITFEPSQGWYPYQNGWRIPVWQRVGPMCVLSGLAGGNGGPHVANLPSSCWPKKRAVFHTSHYAWSARLDVLPDGRILYVEGGRNWGYVSLDGIRFVVDSDETHPGRPQNHTVAKRVDIKLEELVSPLARGYAEPAFFRTGALCVGTGVTRQTNMRRKLLQLPEDCRPGALAVFRMGVAAGEMARFDVEESGALRWVRGSSTGAWATLSPFIFPVKGTPMSPLRLMGLWVPRNPDYLPSYVQQGSFCLLSGQVQPEPFQPSWMSFLMRLPATCRPVDGRLIFTFNNDLNNLRYDVLQNGEVHYIVGSTTPTLLSLDGIGFYTHTTSTPLLLLNSWAPYSSGEHGGIAHGGYRVPSFRKEGNLCSLSGLAGGNGGNLMAFVGHECWPRGTMIFHANQHQYASLITVNSTGQIFFEYRDSVITEGGGRYHGWVSLDGIYWIVDSFDDPNEALSEHLEYRSTEGEALELKNQFEPYRYEGELFRPPIFTKMESVVILSGATAGPDIKKLLTVLPANARPAKRLVFDVHGEYTSMMRVDVFADGRVKWVAGAAESSWMSLDSIIYAVNGTFFNPIQLDGRYVNFGEGYADASYYVQDNLCVLQGLIRDRYYEHLRGHVGVLGSDCRPREGQLIFRSNSMLYTHRIDVGTNGWIYYQWGTNYQMDYRSLAGIAFFIVSNRQLPLINGYGVYGGGYRPPSINKQGNLCMLSGLASGNAMSVITVVPEECRPRERLIFAMANHNYNPRFDLFPDGRLVSVYMQVQHNWVSLDMVRYVVPERNRPVVPVSKDGPISRAEIALSANFSAYKRGYEDPEYQRFGGLCQLSGLARTVDFRSTWATLPAACRPAKRQVFDQHIAGTTTARVDVLPSGVVRYVAGGGETNFASFDGIIFPVKGAPVAPLELMHTWSNFGGGYQEATYMTQGSICLLQGFIKPWGIHTNSWYGEMARLPQECVPKDGHLIVNLNYNEYTHQGTVHQNGILYWGGTNQPRRQNLMSLSGVVYPMHAGKTIQFLSGNWYPYQNGYRVTSFVVQGDTCFLTGLARGNGARELAILPPECRPSARLVFHVNHHVFVHRMDVLPSGLIEWVDGPRHWDWVSLDQIHFATAKKK